MEHGHSRDVGIGVGVSHMKFTAQWIFTAVLGVITIYVLVQNVYEPGATTAATALAFGFAPLVAGVVLFNLWDWQAEDLLGHADALSVRDVPDDSSALK